MSLKMNVNEPHLDEIECEEEEDGSLTLYIPDELVKKVMEFTIINALEGLVKEYENNKGN
jgi:hypothetical protein